MDTAELLLQFRKGRPFPAMDYGRCLPTPTSTSFRRAPSGLGHPADPLSYNGSWPSGRSVVIQRFLAIRQIRCHTTPAEMCARKTMRPEKIRSCFTHYPWGEVYLASQAMPDNWEKVQEVFFAAADLPSAEQQRFLEGACRGNPDLRRDVDSLLVADRTHSHDIDLAVEAAAQQMVGGDPAIGARFGSWRVSREIGRGGMGIVYLAIRDDAQFQKQAALKLIRAGMDTAELLLRFRHERQILASLDHPYIARLIDGGTTPEGRPFLVMDYVEGLRIDHWCRDRGIAVEDRCRLFLKVCEAVSYAHRSLVVHRDLKPGNILIAADGSPKL